MIKKIFSIIIVLCSFFVSSCGGVKKYKLPSDVKQEAKVTIDGSKSITSGFFRGTYTTFISIVKPYPDTCEAYSYGTIKTTSNHSSEPYPLPSDMFVLLQYAREQKQGGGNSISYSTKTASLYFKPEAGKEYSFQTIDNKKGLFDLKVFEISGEKKEEFKKFLADDQFKNCKKVKYLKKLKG